MAQIRVVVMILLVAFATLAYAKPSPIPKESQGAPTDEEIIASVLDYAVEAAAERGEIPAEARGWWSRFRDRYVRPAFPSIAGALISRG